MCSAQDILRYCMVSLNFSLFAIYLIGIVHMYVNCLISNYPYCKITHDKEPLCILYHHDWVNCDYRKLYVFLVAVDLYLFINSFLKFNKLTSLFSANVIIFLKIWIHIVLSCLILNAKFSKYCCISCRDSYFVLFCPFAMAAVCFVYKSKRILLSTWKFHINIIAQTYHVVVL